MGFPRRHSVSAGDRRELNCLVASCSKCTVCQLPQFAIWHSAKPENRAKVGGIEISAALASFPDRYHQAIGILAIFVAPILYIIHAVEPGIPNHDLLGMADGTSFSHDLIRLHRSSQANGNKL